ncbi:hypothetical protein V6M85_05925 [Sulfolobus tengchongensis]|uniref:Uncharacterized protein n=1 Tax=Sulfolobus tengchongensis TaxID=207809 RepID=A0AAX4L5T0_9CREN
MKILIIAPLSSQSSKGDKIVPLEVTNWSNSAVEIESRIHFWLRRNF